MSQNDKIKLSLNNLKVNRTVENSINHKARLLIKKLFMVAFMVQYISQSYKDKITLCMACSLVKIKHSQDISILLLQNSKHQNNNNKIHN